MKRAKDAIRPLVEAGGYVSIKFLPSKFNDGLNVALQVDFGVGDNVVRNAVMFNEFTEDEIARAAIVLCAWREEANITSA